MKKEWYFRLLITALASLLVMQHQMVVPNQEIVLEFTDDEVSSIEIQNAIAAVKKQLESIGVKDTRVSERLSDGTLKIAYYSDADIESIRKVLSDNQSVAFGHVFYDQHEGDHQLPIDTDAADYNLDIYEIQKSSDITKDYTGMYVLEIKQKQDRASGSKVYDFVAETHTNGIDGLLKVAQKVNRSIAITIDTTSYQIPEVRAGPTV